MSKATKIQESIDIAKKNLKWMIKKNSPIFCALSTVTSSGGKYYRLYALRKRHKGMKSTHSELVDITEDYGIAAQWPYYHTERRYNALYIHSSPGNNIERNLVAMGITVGMRVYL